MEASRPLLQQSPVDTAEDMIDELMALAEAGDWEQLEHVAVMLRSSIMDVPEAERGRIVIAAQQAAGQASSIAEKARGDVASRLRSLRLGQSAARAYKDTTGYFGNPGEFRTNP